MENGVCVFLRWHGSWPKTQYDDPMMSMPGTTKIDAFGHALHHVSYSAPGCWVTLGE